MTLEQSIEKRKHVKYIVNTSTLPLLWARICECVHKGLVPTNQVRTSTDKIVHTI